MDEDRRNFQAWYVDILRSLYAQRNAGIAVLMISAPLLERYMRAKAGRAPDQNIDAACLSVLRTIFPKLPDESTARAFWNVYRYGFLPQAFLSLRTQAGRSLPKGALTHDITDPIQVESNGDFTLNPVKFSQEIVRVIEGDFATFVAAGTA